MTTQKSKIQPSHARGSLVHSSELPILQQGENLLVDAQLLHRHLKSSGRFYDWINYRIKEYGFVENQDFFATKKVQSKQGGHNKVEYHLTFDMAKELCMLEKSEIGRSYRRYFIQKEKESRIGLLPKDAEVFHGIKRVRMNNRDMYPYMQFLRQKAGYSAKSSGYHYRAAYAGHFVVFDGLTYISSELALQIYHSRRLAAARAANKAMQPVLPFNFGEPVQLKGGASC